MKMETKKLIWVLLFIILLLAGLIAQDQIKDYGVRRYSTGMQQGQYVLAADQFGRGYVMFFNGTAEWAVTFQELCGGSG